MFRQKFAQVTNIPCRLIPNGKDEYMLFKNPNSNPKPTIKEQKQKFSLKNQTTSSSKHETKVTSAQKGPIKVIKQNQEQKISISGNIESKKKKTDKTELCSPQNSQIKRIDQNIIINRQINQIQNKTSNYIKTVQNNRIKQQKKLIRNSHNHALIQNNINSNVNVSNFGNYHYNGYNTSGSKMVQLSKKPDNFEQYYKLVPNPYALNDKNKENPNLGEQISHYKIAKSRIDPKRALRDIGNQLNAVDQVSTIFKPQIFHESLEKFQNGRIKQSRGTYNGTLTTKNSLNSDSSKENTQFSRLQNDNVNSKKTKIIQNPSLIFNKSLKPTQLQDFNNNRSQVFTHRDFKNQKFSKNQQFHNLIPTQTSLKGNFESLFKQRPTTYMPFQSKKSRTTQNSHIYQFNTYEKDFINDCSIQNSLLKSQIFPTKKPLNQIQKNKVVIQRLNTFNDILTSKQQCQSLLDESQENSNKNEQSFVLMRYKDLLTQSEFSTNQHIKQLAIDNNETSFKKQVKPNNFIFLKQFNQDFFTQNILKNNQKLKNFNDSSTNQSKFLTNVKLYGKKENNLINDSSITCNNNNMKKTVKLTKEYLTNNFNLHQ